MKEVISKMKEMRLPIMAAELEVLLQSKDYSKLSANEVVQKIVEAEYQAEKIHTINRYIKQAKFTDSTARLENIDYAPDRKINDSLIKQLSSNQYIQNHRNLIILGATGSGKSFIANGLGIHACQAYYRTQYRRLPELLDELSIARAEGCLTKIINQFQKSELVIIDDFLLVQTTPTEQQNLMEFFEYRSRGKSTILCSQMETSEWHDKLGGSALADAICDRILSNSYEIILQGDSRRKQSK